MTWLALATLIAGWLLLLATGWLLFVAWLRLSMAKERLAIARRRVELGDSMLGASLRDEQEEGPTDQEEAYRENLARHRRWFNRTHGGAG